MLISLEFDSTIYSPIKYLNIHLNFEESIVNHTLLCVNQVRLIFKQNAVFVDTVCLHILNVIAKSNVE